MQRLPFPTIHPPPTTDGALGLLCPPLRNWFVRRYSAPTAAQRHAWPILLTGQSLLLAAPTGGGKTWAALLPLFQAWLAKPASGGPRCLYLSPMRALCNDLYHRLVDALAELAAAGSCKWRVGLLTGDTPQGWRKRLWERPPELLITTPESLALLLARPDSEERFQCLQSVVIDEVHALAGIKRGADLSICLERLDRLASHPLQRIGLSATASPLRLLANWLGGSGGPLPTANVPDQREWNLRIEHLGEVEEGKFLSTFLDRLEPEIESCGTTLLFTNMRSMAERLAWCIRRRRPEWAEQIAVHHGSLAADLRAEVEARLQAGELRLAISSSSLELGVDIGDIDQVLMLHPPGGVARLMQRLGRSGHKPNRTRRGVLYTTNLDELWEATVTRAAGQLVNLEPIAIPDGPLDVLCQQLLGMALHRPFTASGAWALVRGAAPFANLSLADFSRCLEYLTGGSAAATVPPRLRLIDGYFHLVNRRTARLFRQNTGTITTENLAEVRLVGGRVVGALNTHWADRLQPGDRFQLGGTTLQVVRRMRGDLEVDAKGGTPVFARWMGGFAAMPPILAERIWRLRLRLHETYLESGEHAISMLHREYGVPGPLATLLLEQLELQDTLSEVPADGLLVESWPEAGGETAGHAFHLPFTPTMAEGLAQVVALRLGQDAKTAIIAGRLGFILALPATVELTPKRLRTLLRYEGFEKDLNRAMARSLLFALRFSEVAKTGMMILRHPVGRRRAVGGQNWTGDRLLHWLRFAQPDFPLLLQTQRELQSEVYHSERIAGFLAKLTDKPIRQRWLREPSPFAAEWFMSPFQSPTNLGEPRLDSALLRIHQERQAAHAAS